MPRAHNFRQDAAHSTASRQPGTRLCRLLRQRRRAVSRRMRRDDAEAHRLLAAMSGREREMTNKKKICGGERNAPPRIEGGINIKKYDYKLSF